MTTYRLPAELGGIEVREAGKRGDGRMILVPVASELAELDWEFCLDRSALAEVKPSVPPEPEMGRVVLDRAGNAWQRWTSGWRCDAVSVSWYALNAKGAPLTLLAPDPVASAPELPWEWRDEDQIPFGVQLHGLEPLVAFDSTCPRYYMPLDQAEQLALAILRAAREASAAS